MKSHKDDFTQWSIEMNKKVHIRLSEVTNIFNTDLIVGQKCTFNNDYGVKFPGCTIMGFCERQNNIFTGEDTGRYVYLDYDCYWMPAKTESIILERDSYSDVPLTSSTNKILVADIESSFKEVSLLKNIRIIDKPTGRIETLNTGNIDIASQPLDIVKNLLSGSKVEIADKTGITNLVKLNKTVTGWGISISKQAFNAADSSAGI